MANLKEIRLRIASVGSTKQITSAMKMVSAAKLKKAQDTIVNFRPYASKMQDIMSNLALAAENSDNAFMQDNGPNNVLIVVVTSNKGLCGAFNSNIIKEALNLAETRYAELVRTGNVRFMAIGKKGYENLRKRNIPVNGDYVEMIEGLTYEKVVSLTDVLIDSFLDKTYDHIHIIYNEFKNAAVQRVITDLFLPLFQEEEIGEDYTPFVRRNYTNYIYEPSQDEILEELIPKSLQLGLYKALLDSTASEHGARMTSMQQATENATTLIQELTLLYNKARQASITNDLVEIVGGAEALKG